MGSGTLSNLERGVCPTSLPVLNRILTFFREATGEEAFPGPGDLFDQVIPVKDFGSWLRNFRLRRGLEQVELARELGVSKVTVCRYERQGCRPDAKVLKRLKRRFDLNGELDQFFK